MIMDYDVYCTKCDFYFNVIEDVNGSCPNCGCKYEWDYDCEDIGDAVNIPHFESDTYKID
jgi:hypothetical protein